MNPVWILIKVDPNPGLPHWMDQGHHIKGTTDLSLKWVMAASYSSFDLSSRTIVIRCFSSIPPVGPLFLLFQVSSVKAEALGVAGPRVPLSLTSDLRVTKTSRRPAQIKSDQTVIAPFTCHSETKDTQSPGALDWPINEQLTGPWWTWWFWLDKRTVTLSLLRQTSQQA